MYVYIRIEITASKSQTKDCVISISVRDMILLLWFNTMEIISFFTCLLKTIFSTVNYLMSIKTIIIFQSVKYFSQYFKKNEK